MTTPLNAASRVQAQAAVQGWQQTVSAAWDQQNGMLAGQTATDRSGPDVVAARGAFFTDKLPPGTQRKIIRTNATVPGGKDGIIVSRMYIADKLAAVNQLYGDDRGPSTNPRAGSRVSVAWDTRNGEVSIIVHPSKVHESSVFNEQSPYTRPRDVGAWPINIGPKTIGKNFSNNFVVNAAPGRLDVKYDLINSGLPDVARWGAVQGQTSISVQGNQISGNARGEDYPDREVVQYRSDGARLLNNLKMADSGWYGGPVIGTDFDTPRGQWRVTR
jgi:hypothetical protein